MEETAEVKVKIIKEDSKIKRIHVGIILDRSGSMGSIAGEICQSFNSQINKINEKSKEIDTDVTLVTFSNEVDKIDIFAEPADAVAELNSETYHPDGLTALYDAIGELVERFEKLEDAKNEDVSFLIFIFSDGLNNNSNKYSATDIAEKIQSLQATNHWTFTYLGTDHDLGTVRKDTGFLRSNMMGFAKNAVGVGIATSSVSRGLDNYYSKAKLVGASMDAEEKLSEDFFEDEKKEEK